MNVTLSRRERGDSLAVVAVSASDQNCAVPYRCSNVLGAAIGHRGGCGESVSCGIPRGPFSSLRDRFREAYTCFAKDE